MKEKNSKISTTEVLIVGAGPTGLMLACQLALRKVSFRIIDQSKDHTRQSRALVIQARSLEILDQMGLLGAFLKEGKKAKAFNFWVHGHPAVRLDLSKIGKTSTQFPYFLILEQAKTEALFLRFLKKQGVSVARETRLSGLTQTQASVKVTLESAAGKEVLRANYLVGADGAHSAVRHLLKEPFEGSTYDKYFFVMDCKSDWKGPQDEIYACFGKKDFALFLHMKQKNKLRVIGMLPEGLDPKKPLRFKDLYPALPKALGLKLKLYDPLWISAYHAHHRHVKRFKVGRCFLAGDAAHIHSPVGGQGMNTGLQDAYNLAWKLSLVLNKEAQEALLETYTAERLEVARQLVQTTDRMFSIIISEKAWARFFRLRLFPWMANILLPLGLAKKVFSLASQLRIAYLKSPLSVPPSSKLPIALQPGKRFPYLWIHNKPVEKYLNPLKCTLWLWGTPEKMNDLKAKITLQWGNLMEIQSFSKNPLKKWIRGSEGQCLIRPDRHIAYFNLTLEVKGLEAYLKQWFIPLPSPSKTK